MGCGTASAAREQAAQLQDWLRGVSIAEDRDRTAGDLRDKGIQRIFAAGLTLQSAAMRTTDPGVRRQIEESVDDLDDAVVILRDSVYGLEHCLKGRGLRAEILQLYEELHLAPELSFTGPVEGALPPAPGPGSWSCCGGPGLIGQHFVVTRIEITASGDSYTAIVDTRPLAGATGITTSSGLRIFGTGPPGPGSVSTSSQARARPGSPGAFPPGAPR
jgi:hypothetical protein